MRTSCTTLPGRAASTQAHEGRNQWFQQRPRITDMGRLRAEGAWNRWLQQRPRSNDQGAASHCKISTEASGTEQFLPKFRLFDYVLQYKNNINPKKNRTLRRTF